MGSTPARSLIENLSTFVSFGQHRLGKVDRLVRARPNDFSPALLEHPGAAGLVVGAGGLVQAVEGELNGHLLD